LNRRGRLVRTITYSKERITQMRPTAGVGLAAFLLVAVGMAIGLGLANGCTGSAGKPVRRGPEANIIAEDRMEKLIQSVEKQRREALEAFDLSVAKQVVAEIEAGKLSPGSDNVVSLPERFAKLAGQGRVYLTQGRSHSRAYLFPIWVAKGSNLYGFLCVSGPVADFEMSYDSPSDQGSFTGLLPCSVGEPDKGDVDIIDSPEAGWFRVSRTLD
jgi:hypothetical protein